MEKTFFFQRGQKSIVMEDHDPMPYGGYKPWFDPHNDSRLMINKKL